MKRPILVVISLCVCFYLGVGPLSHGALSAQAIGLHPPSVDWQQLRTEQGRVIFPAGYEQRARRVASLIDHMADTYTRGIGEQLYDFDLVLQTPNLTVNGYVGLAPFRSEFFASPPQSFNLLSGIDWVDLLTIHEFRHVQQASNERRGITRLFSYLQGQLGWAVFGSLAVPNWFAEGDAVIAETALTGLGRGRTPAFSSNLRALLHNDIIYKYRQARNGSLYDLTPDHYRYGYAMLTQAREEFGPYVWRDVLQQGAAYRGLFYPFSRALKRATGYSTRDLYRRTMQELQARQDSFLKANPATLVGDEIPARAPWGDVRDYRFSFTDADGRLLALRTSYRKLPALVSIDPATGKEDIITPIGIQREPWLDGTGRLAVWTELRQHPRYTNQNYSDIVLYELRSGRKRTLTRQGRYLSATLSPHGNRIAAVHYDALEAVPELHLLDTNTGQLHDRYRLDQYTNISWPRFGSDGRTIYFLAQSVDGLGIASLDAQSREVTILLPPRYEPLDMLRVAPTGELLYVSGRSGIDNVYRLDPAAPQDVSQLTDVPLGAYYPYLDASKGVLYYTAPTSLGDRLFELPLSTLPGDGFPPEPARPSVYERPAAFAEQARNLPREIEVRDYPASDYSNTFGGIRLHSWSFNGSYVSPGLGINFDNALNTFSASVFGNYNINEARYGGGANVLYGGLPVVVGLTGGYDDRNTIVQADRTDSLRIFGQEFSELSVGPDLSYPLSWVSGNFFTGLMPTVGYRYIDLRGTDVEQRLPGAFSSLSFALSLSSLRRLARRQVQSRLGMRANLVYDRALGDNRPGERFRLRSSLFLPAPFATHGIRIDADYQSEQAENLYQYVDRFQYARGFAQPLADQVYRLGVNYQLPLLYPDYGALGIVYLKRVRLLGFFDYSRFNIDAFPNATFTERSIGGQLYFDATWLNTQDIPVGVEFAYRLDDDLFRTTDRPWELRLLLTGSF